MRLYVLAFCLFSIAAPGVAQTVVGKWLGHKSSQEGVSCWLAERKEDGRYRTDFLVQQAGKTVRHIEEGRWVSSNGMYATIVEAMNGDKVNLRDKYFREFYIIEKLTESEFSYRDIGSGMRFVVRRIDAGYQLPNACPTAP